METPTLTQPIDERSTWSIIKDLCDKLWLLGAITLGPIFVLFNSAKHFGEAGFRNSLWTLIFVISWQEVAALKRSKREHQE